MKQIISAALTAFAFTLAAPQFASAAATGTAVTVSQIHVYSDGHYDVLFSGNICNDSSATNKSWGHANAATPPSQAADGLKDMLSILSAAKLSGKSVTVYTSGVSGSMCAISGVALY